MTINPLSKEFAEALVKVQGSIEGAKKGRENTFFKDGKGKAAKYADLAACWDACREALQTNGIAVVQLLTGSPPGYVGIKTLLIYGATGEVLSDTFNVPLKDPTNAQALGSAVTYGRRYSLCAAIGICPEDDDGNAASATPRAAKAVANTGSQVGANAAAFRASFAGTQTIEEMKQVYSEVKNSDLPEPAKTSLLKEMADRIKIVKESK